MRDFRGRIAACCNVQSPFSRRWLSRPVLQFADKTDAQITDNTDMHMTVNLKIFNTQNI